MSAEETPADRLRLALAMHDFGVRMYRQRMVREHPAWTEGEVEAAVSAWLQEPEEMYGRPVSPERWQRLTSGPKAS